MYALNRVNSKWLAQVSTLALLFLLIPVDASLREAGVLHVLIPASMAGIVLLFYGLLVAARDEVPGASSSGGHPSGYAVALEFIRGFLSRPANFVTGFRLLLVLAGTGMAAAGLGFGAVLVSIGFLLDFVDGWLARNEEPSGIPAVSPEKRAHSLPRLLGPWFDAESDALALLLAGWALVVVGGASGVLLALVGARYGFGLLFAFVPGSPAFKPWYRWYSRTAAALLQTWLALAWLVFAYGPGASVSGFVHGPAFMLAAASIAASFALESVFRYVYYRTLFASGGWGLFVSFLRYYRVPFRSCRAGRLYRGFLEPGDLFFDVGSHVGGRIDVVRALGCRVVAFEPQPACVDLLEAWYGDRPEVIIVPQALGREEGSLDLYASPGNPTLASVDAGWVDRMGGADEFRGIRWEKAGVASVTTLDKAVARYGMPKFIKLDVEGFEAAVLEGLSEGSLSEGSLLGGVDAYSFEFLAVDKDRALRCLELIRSFGHHEYNFTAGESFRFQFEPWLSFEEAAAFIRARTGGLPGGDIYARRVHRG
jgi:FkbM family methyltransferase